jgi:BirA family biotin operon repressor/biotin-[acetyl-CoA-carboxylase] ligase
MRVHNFPDRLEKLLGPGDWGHPLVWYASIGSTNDAALDLARQGFPQGTVVGAEIQTKGRGRAGRSWFSPGGAGLWFSLVLRPSLPTASLGRIGLWSSVALAGSLYRSMGTCPDLSWPNDVVVGGKKLAGILAESSGDADSVDYVVLGMGLNVNQRPDDFPDELRAKATSMLIVAGRELDRAVVLSQLLQHFRRSFETHQASGFSGVADEWKAHSGLLGRRIEVRWGSERLRGEAADIGEDGELLLRLPSGALRRISWGEASIL